MLFLFLFLLLVVLEVLFGFLGFCIFLKKMLLLFSFDLNLIFFGGWFCFFFGVKMFLGVEVLFVLKRCLVLVGFVVDVGVFLVIDNLFFDLVLFIVEVFLSGEFLFGVGVVFVGVF